MLVFIPDTRFTKYQKNTKNQEQKLKKTNKKKGNEDKQKQK